jgi:hypothetical protein
MRDQVRGGAPSRMPKSAPIQIGRAPLECPLRAGMTGTARIQAGRRTLIEYAFEPLRQLRENVRVHPDS